jgi:hypothetical protein
MLIFIEMKKKKNVKKKIQIGHLKTSFSSSANSQYFFMKISRIGPLDSRIDRCEWHWCCLVLSCCGTASQPYELSQTNALPSINSTNPRTNPSNFHKKNLRIGGAGK